MVDKTEIKTESENFLIFSCLNAQLKDSIFLLLKLMSATCFVHGHGQQEPGEVVESSKDSCLCVDMGTLCITASDCILILFKVYAESYHFLKN